MLRLRVNQINGAGRDLKYKWAQFNKIAIKNKILGICNSVLNRLKYQFCAIIPQSAKQEILELAHLSAYGNHFGF